MSLPNSDKDGFFTPPFWVPSKAASVSWKNLEDMSLWTWAAFFWDSDIEASALLILLEVSSTTP